MNKSTLQAKETINQLLEDPSLQTDKESALRQKLNALPSSSEDGLSEKLQEHVEGERPVLFSPHLVYPSLSSAIQIKYETNRGRFGIASKDIKAGETLIFEAPTGAVLKKFMSEDHCNLCLKSCRGFQVPCTRCVNARFCSEECLAKAEASYHPYECDGYTKNICAFMEDFLQNLQGEGGAVGYYRLLLRLMAQKPLEFFEKHQDWDKRPDENFAPQQSAKIHKSVTQPYTHPNHDSSGLFYDNFPHYVLTFVFLNYLLFLYSRRNKSARLLYGRKLQRPLEPCAP